MLTTPKDAYIPQQFKVLVYSIVDAQPFPLFIQNCYRTSNLHKVLDYLTGISLPSSLQDQWVGEDTLIIFVFYDIVPNFHVPQKCREGLLLLAMVGMVLIILGLNHLGPYLLYLYHIY